MAICIENKPQTYRAKTDWYVSLPDKIYIFGKKALAVRWAKICQNSQPDALILVDWVGGDTVINSDKSIVDTRITRVWHGQGEAANTSYYVGQCFVIRGRLSGCWQTVTPMLYTEGGARDVLANISLWEFHQRT